MAEIAGERIDAGVRVVVAGVRVGLVIERDEGKTIETEERGIAREAVAPDA